MVNPLTAPTPVAPIEAEPLLPVEPALPQSAVPAHRGAAGLGGPAGRRCATRLTNAGTALNGERRIDRDAIFRLKQEALEALFARFHGEQGFDWFCAGEGQALTDFATYAALAERHGKDWRRWPAGCRRPDGADVARLPRREAARIRFHAWTQWLIDGQLARASRDIAVIHDLPIGLDIAGADAWCWQDLMARDVSVGAPADEFNANGQDWGLTPFIPGRLRAAHYRPFIETIRAMLRHAGGLRIDHVMGLFRLFWIPRALGAKGGAYVRSRADELLAIVALESLRAQAFIVGEDLGTVEAGVRERLAEQRMLSYRLLYFEPAPPREFPELALSSVTTHDLPTIAGLWTGADLDGAASGIGLDPNEDGNQGAARQAARARRSRRRTRPRRPRSRPPTARSRRRRRGSCSRRWTTPSRVPERPNVPGTVREWPNWSLALPQPLEEIETMELPRRARGAFLPVADPPVSWPR